MRKRKNTKLYIFYGLLIAAYIIASGFWIGGPVEMPPKDPDADLVNIAYMVWVIGFGILIGIIGALEQRKYTGYWMFEWSKFIVFVSVGLLVTVMHFISLPVPELIKPYLEMSASYLKSDIILLFGLFLVGWAIPASIYKERTR